MQIKVNLMQIKRIIINKSEKKISKYYKKQKNKTILIKNIYKINNNNSHSKKNNNQSCYRSKIKSKFNKSKANLILIISKIIRNSNKWKQFALSGVKTILMIFTTGLRNRNLSKKPRFQNMLIQWLKNEIIKIRNIFAL